MHFCKTVGSTFLLVAVMATSSLGLELSSITPQLVAGRDHSARFDFSVSTTTDDLVSIVLTLRDRRKIIRAEIDYNMESVTIRSVAAGTNRLTKVTSADLQRLRSLYEVADNSTAVWATLLEAW
jgi:hypothetical protein